MTKMQDCSEGKKDGGMYIRAITNIAWNVICLGGSTGRMYKYNTISCDILSVERSTEKLVVGSMYRVAALKGHYIFSRW